MECKTKVIINWNNSDTEELIVMKTDFRSHPNSNSCKGKDKFWKQLINRLLHCFIIQLTKWHESYKHVGKMFKFFADVAWNTIMDKVNIKITP